MSFFQPSYDVRAKVRIGVKGLSATGREIPKSVDYFLSDDAEFASLCGEKPKKIRVRFPFAAPEDNFSTGTEWWRGKQLTCYSKGDTTPPVAFRVKDQVTESNIIVGTKVGNDRLPIFCGFRSCPQFISRDCKPMGRLVFFLDGGKTDSVLEIDTKSWNSIEGIQASMAQLGDMRGRVFELAVAIQQKATKKFPVISITEVDVEVNTAGDVSRADLFLQLQAALAQADDGTVRTAVAAALDDVSPGWRERPEVIEKIKNVGVRVAGQSLLDRNP